MSKDIGNACTECGCDTSFGHGNFVDRIPSDNGEVSGYLCAGCQCVECDKCGASTLEYEATAFGDIWCSDCL